MRELEGTLIGDRFRLERFVDEGAFGAVFRASQLAYGRELRQVAIKIAKRSMTDIEARHAFRDAMLLAKVANSSPDTTIRQHFVTVHDAGRCPAGSPVGGHPYLVMEWVTGGSLGAALRVGAFPLQRAVDYFDQMLRAMVFMHGGADGDGNALSIAHRDLKPDNILVTRLKDAPDVIKVADFGLAVEVESQLGWVDTGGTLSYMAPESFTHGVCSLQSDVYALGLIFFEMVTNRQPFGEVGSHLQGSEAATRDERRRLHVAARQLERFHELEEHVELRRHRGLAQVIRNCLVADMNTRPYRSAVDLAGAWQDARRGAAPEPARERPWVTARRLANEAAQCFAVGDTTRGQTLLEEAMELNGDPNRVPDTMVEGSIYLMAVERLLKTGATDEAGRLAQEGHSRRESRSTKLAMARYLSAVSSPLAGQYERDAQACPDEEPAG